MNAALETLRRLWRRHTFACVCVVVILLAGGGDWFFWRRLQEQTRRQAEIRTRSDTLLQALATLATITAQHAAAEQAVARIDRHLITEGDLAGNAAIFFQCENDCQIQFTQLNQLSSQPPTEGSPYRAVPFALRVTADFPRLMRLLRELEQMPHVNRVRTFSLNRTAGADMELNLTVEFLALR